MPTKIEKDAVTGTETTGHEWDGIKELNTPLPKWWLYTFYVCIAFAVVWWILFPSWPGINGYFGGIIGSNQRLELEGRLTVARADQAVYLERVAAADIATIAQDQELISFALTGGQAAFADNCAPCHGLGGAGQGHYPNLADDAWIWGGTLDDIHTTILHGIRNGSDDARFNEMPAFGAMEILSREEIGDVTEHLLAYGGRSEDPAAAARGAEIFVEQCAVCHGEAGEGIPELGGPRLSDEIWLYGGTREEILAQIHQPRQGVMPGFQGRLDEDTIKLLTVYVHTLGGGQ